METIRETLIKQKTSLKIHIHKKALILRALIREDFNVARAYELNYETKQKSLDSYYKEVLTYFPGGVTQLKTQYQKEKQNGYNRTTDQQTSTSTEKIARTERDFSSRAYR